MASDRDLGSRGSLSLSTLGRFNRMFRFSNVSESRLLGRIASASVVLAGGILVSHRMVRGTPQLHCVNLFTAKCGGVSVTATGRGKVIITGTNDCSAGTITRRIVTCVLVRFARVTGCSTFIGSNN